MSVGILYVHNLCHNYILVYSNVCGHTLCTCTVGILYVHVHFYLKKKEIHIIQCTPDIYLNIES